MGIQRLRTTAALAAAIGLAVVIGACTRSASTPPATTGEDEGTPSVLTSQQQTMEAVRSDLLTQTAQASEAEATETPEPTAVVATEAATVSPTADQGTPTSPSDGTPFVGEVPDAYTLQEGEHPFCIARRFDVDPIRLLGVNGLDPSVVPSTGYRLIIPQDTAGFPGERALREHPATYTVQAGDTIYAIACMFGDVWPAAIAQANGLTEPYDLTAGTVLQIP